MKSKLRQLVGTIEELSFPTIRQQLIAALVKLAEDDGKRINSAKSFRFSETGNQH